ncbi:MAG: hydrogenase maturation protease [Gemmatimonadetes bacterium]|nr:hydrogenase maturation protease [Gemmatimonadota bacterium]
MRVLVGGVGYRFQTDLSFGLHVSDALQGEGGLDGVDVMDLGYGAIFVSQDLAGADPPYDRVVLVSAATRGREPGLYERRPEPALESVDEIQERVREAGAGVIDLDHLLVIGEHFHAFPADLRLVEVEPVESGPGDGLSAAVERLLPDAIRRVRAAALEPQLAGT